MADGSQLPLADGAKLLANFFEQRARRCDELGHPDDARRHRSYGGIVARLWAAVPDDYRGTDAD